EFKLSAPDETSVINTVTPIYLILMFITITILLLIFAKDRYELEEDNKKSVAVKNALSTALKETNVANKSKSIFLTHMSHELRTPLNIILGYSQALKLDSTGVLNKKQTGFVNNIQFEGKRLLNLINDLLNLSNIQAGKFKKELTKIRLNDILQPQLAVIKKITDEYNISLHVINDLDDVDGLVYVLGRQDWFEQIYVALIDNAAKYGNKNGIIWINAFLYNDDTIRITFKDKGHGISSTEIENVFKSFNRAGVDSRAIEGTGAGLAIVKGLIDFYQF
ncbi:MAG: HAMP domain-containing sensor histidine kinase, partial [Emcibacteraceae bacterium]|nr:HAMP domain-containing sensor histidine kinase [Emcibacteraceae bacterium]